MLICVLLVKLKSKLSHSVFKGKSDIWVRSDFPNGYAGSVPRLRHDVSYTNTAFEKKFGHHLSGTSQGNFQVYDKSLKSELVWNLYYDNYTLPLSHTFDLRVNDLGKLFHGLWQNYDLIIFSTTKRSGSSSHLNTFPLFKRSKNINTEH